MKLIKPSQISGEILTLFEEADDKVIIISPYCNISKWYKLINKLKSLIERRVKIEFYVREGEFSSIEEINKIGIEPIPIKNLHSKIYMNEKEAIITSMNLLFSSEINSLDIAYKTTTTEEYEELLQYYNRYIKIVEREDLSVDKNYLHQKLTNKYNRIKIFYESHSLRIQTHNNNYEAFIWNLKDSNKLRISAILSNDEFEKSVGFKEKMQDKLKMKIEFIVGNQNYYNTVWATSIETFKTQEITEINLKDQKKISDYIYEFVNEIQKIKDS